MGACTSDSKKKIYKRKSFDVWRNSFQNGSQKSISERRAHRKTERDLLEELFDSYDKDHDNYLNQKELKEFYTYLCQKKRMEISIDEQFIGRFLTKAGVFQQVRISKAEFVAYFNSQ